MQEQTGFGAYLRACREARGFSVDDLSAATRIVPRLIRALEDDRFGDLPAPVFVRGFIRAYCAHVGAPPESLLERYAAQREAESGARATEAAPPLAPKRSLVRPTVTAGVVTSLLVAVGGGLYLLTPSGGTPPPAPPPGAATSQAIAAPGEDAGGNAGPGPANGVSGPPAESPVPAGRAPRLLVVRAHDVTWIRVKPEDGPATQEVLPAGAVREWRSVGGFSVTLGNAGGVSLELDGVVLPPLGGSGEVVRDIPVPREPSP